MNTAYNPLGELEECTRTAIPHFTGDYVVVLASERTAKPLVGTLAKLDTVDLDGNDEYCRVIPLGESRTEIVHVADIL